MRFERLSNLKTKKVAAINMIPKLKKIEATDDLILVMHYDNGEIRSLDFKKEDLSGAMAPLKHIAFFKKAFLSDYGMVEFPNDIQLDPIGLYEDSIPGDLRKQQVASEVKKPLLAA